MGALYFVHLVALLLLFLQPNALPAGAFVLPRTLSLARCPFASASRRLEGGENQRLDGNSSAEAAPDFVVPDADGFYLRSARFKDLNAVAQIFVDSFYEKSMLRHYYYMLELQRIQNNYPYDTDWHDYYVACASSDDSVVAFVDVDARKLPSHWGMSAPPRPYLSDLAVRDDWRRKGVATQLVVRCEDKAREMGYARLYLRVERDNDAALNMYERMGYEVQEHPYFGVKDTTTLLLGLLFDRSRLEDRIENGRDEEPACRGAVGLNATSAAQAVDYVV